METVAAKLKQWHGAKVVKKREDIEFVPAVSHNRLCLELNLSTDFDRIMEWLLFHKPELAKKVEESYRSMLEWAEWVDSENQKNNLLYLMDLILSVLQVQIIQGEFLINTYLDLYLKLVMTWKNTSIINSDPERMFFISMTNQVRW